MASAFAVPVRENDDDVVSDLSVRAWSCDVNDEKGNDVVTEGATVEEGEAPFLSASEDVPSEDGTEVDATVILQSRKEYDAP